MTYPDHILFGTAYYEEYLPAERLETDFKLMKAAHINLIRIAESTWSTEEPSEGQFDFSHVLRVLEAASRWDIAVIIGTPTYAIPPWMAAAYPEVLAITETGRGRYGPRQIMDISHPTYRFFAERIIRSLMTAVQPYKAVLGVQLDNETKPYHTAGPNVQRQFVRWLRARYGQVAALNQALGLSYWSNSIDAWENLPDVTGTINGSLAALFAQFQRSLVTDFLAWQADIVREYLHPDQFVTHNFDYDWRGYSYGLQAETDHYQAAACLDIAGCDIYHPSQDQFSGRETAFCSAACWSLKRRNYLVLETQAQGHPDWTPYPGQLRLQAFCHLANGADSVMYWHWHSIHNAVETYWKGILSHDLLPNAVYKEIAELGAELERLSPKLRQLKKVNKVAVLVSQDSLTGLSLFPPAPGRGFYNDIVRLFADALYDLNIEYDLIYPQQAGLLPQYELIVVPALYSAADELLEALQAYAQQGGCLLLSFKCGFTSPELTVAKDLQPHLLTEACGLHYDQFTLPRQVSLTGDAFDLSAAQRQITDWMELLIPDQATVVSRYRHPVWGQYAAVTHNNYGKGQVWYVGCRPQAAYLKALLRQLIHETAKRSGQPVTAFMPGPCFPMVIRSGINMAGHTLHYYFNVSAQRVTQAYLHLSGYDLLSQCPVKSGERLQFSPWAVKIIEEEVTHDHVN